MATPGRSIDHIRRGSLELKNIRTFILNEADESAIAQWWERRGSSN